MQRKEEGGRGRRKQLLRIYYVPDTALRSQGLSSFILTTTLGTINYAHFVNKKNRVSSSNKVTHRKVQINRCTASRRNTSIIGMLVKGFLMTASERALKHGGVMLVIQNSWAMDARSCWAGELQKQLQFAKCQQRSKSSACL